MVILPSIEVYMGCTDAEESVDSLMLICCGILGMLKTVWFRIYARNLTNNYNSARNDYLIVEDAKQRAIMRKHAFTGRTLCCFMLCFSYFSCIIYALIPLFGDDKNKQINVTHENVLLQYTVPSRCALEYLNVPTSMYRTLCLIEAVSLILTSTTNHGNDSMFINITLHVCGQVEILKAKFIEFDVTSPRVYERLITLIKRHCYLIRMARKLADTISFVLLIQLFIISIQLCITGFQFILALKVNDPVMAGKSVMVQSTFLSQLTLYSFIGDYLKTQMEEIGLCIYQNAWYNLPAKITRNLIFIIMRTESPVTLHAGTLFVVNLSSYMSILKASISYLSVLRVMVET
ncbi:odorant receptor 13a [Monomorium pharaonis]|uniref:odorant receptor 13a n=1 Tax=Monomorium pharaonis TaxID=307658 RepID=UPI00102E1B56|nr:odorant receptor 13a [Monomorium pharaonis]